MTNCHSHADDRLACSSGASAARSGAEPLRASLDPAARVRILPGFAPGRPVGRSLARVESQGILPMFAVVRCGGKQYRVAVDDVLNVERLDGEPGATLKLEEVLLLGGDSPKSGAPLIAGASVLAEIVEQGRGEKVVAFKK